MAASPITLYGSGQAAPRRLRLARGRRVFWGGPGKGAVAIYLLYLDEFGHPGPYVPRSKRYSHHPLFGFAGFAVPAEDMRDFDRVFLRFKQRFYSNEIKRANVRSERYEPKELRSRRDIRFAQRVMQLVGDCAGAVFAHGCVTRSSPQNHSYKGLYTSLVQASLRSFEKFLREGPGQGITRGVIIMDRRTETQNVRVLEAAQTHIFSGEMFRRGNVGIVETPLLVPSHWYHGVQAAHVIGQAVGKIYWRRKLGKQKYAKYERHLGSSLKAQTHTIGGWHSVYVRS